MIIKILPLIVFFSLSQQPSDLRTETLEVIHELLIWDEVNPNYKEEAEKINGLLEAVIIKAKDKDHNSNDELRTQLLLSFYETTTNLISDSYELRRQQWKAAVCFACLSLIAEEDKKNSLLEYGKHSISDETGNRVFNENEANFLGLLFIELLNYDELGFERDVKNQSQKIKNYLINNEDKLEKRTLEKTNKLLLKYTQ